VTCAVFRRSSSEDGAHRRWNSDHDGWGKESRPCGEDREKAAKDVEGGKREGGGTAVNFRGRGGSIGAALGAAITRITATVHATSAVRLTTTRLPAEGLGSFHLPRYE
jgi:hypothetical protein